MDNFLWITDEKSDFVDAHANSFKKLDKSLNAREAAVENGLVRALEEAVALLNARVEALELHLMELIAISDNLLTPEEFVTRIRALREQVFGVRSQ